MIPHALKPLRSKFGADRSISARSDTELRYPMAESGVVTGSNRKTDSTGVFPGADYYRSRGVFREICNVARDNGVFSVQDRRRRRRRRRRTRFFKIESADTRDRFDESGNFFLR